MCKCKAIILGWISIACALKIALLVLTLDAAAAVAATC
jgi:hypothetical protein